MQDVGSVMIGIAIIAVLVGSIITSIVATSDVERMDNGDVILNKPFQDACIERGGTVYPLRVGLGGCMIDGYSYNTVSGVSM